MNEVEYQRMFEVEDSHWWYVALHELICGQISNEFIAKGALEILDAGCGTGRLMQLMKSYGAVSGVDISDQALAFCSKRGLERISRADLNHFDPGEKQFDIITSVDVLYHQWISDEQIILARFFRGLKPGGLLILNLVAFEFLRSTHDMAVKTRKRYKLEEIETMLITAGFHIETSTYRLAFLFFPVLLYKFAKKMLPHSKISNKIDSDVKPIPKALNMFFLAITRLENRFIRHAPLPFGSSAFIVARRPETF